MGWSRSSLGVKGLALALLLSCLGTMAAPTEEESDTPSLDPDLVAGKQAIDSKDWAAAIRVLSSAALRDTRNADIQNWLGYAHRNAGRMEQAFTHYARALALNPRHRGAHEYIGEAYLLVHQPAKAQQHLRALQSICLLPCEELQDLKEKIDHYQRPP